MNAIDARRAGGLPAPLLVGAMAVVALALTFGGASLGNPLGTMMVELASVPLLLAAAARLASLRFSALQLAGLGLLLLTIALPLAQLTPLPADVWRQLPGRDLLAQATQLAGVSDRWRPFSLTPEDTWRAVLFLIPPAAAFLVTLQLDTQGRRQLCLVIFAVAVVGGVLGGMQAAGGPEGPLQLYRNSNSGLPVGFFANRNHQAMLMVAAVPLAAAQLAARRSQGAGRGEAAIWLGLIFLLVVSAGATLSRAGIVLLGPAILGGIVLLARGSGLAAARTILLALIAVLAAAFLVAVFQGDNITERFALSPLADARYYTAPVVKDAGAALQPWGGGIGSFDLVYRAAEPLTALSPFYLNHAHNEYAELWIEGGWPALALIAAFLPWWGWATWKSWRNPHGESALLSRAAGLVVPLLLLHSIVDYPLRTPALAVVFAFACGLLCGPSARPRGD